MKPSRRRFLTIMAGCAMSASGSSPAQSDVSVWRGRALGAEAEIRLFGGDKTKTRQAIAAARDTVLRMERLFSLYQPRSALNALNANGFLEMPPEFARLMSLVDKLHRQTDGLFDPTVQPLMVAQARADGELSATVRKALAAKVGWAKVQRQSSHLSFAVPGMAMTLNGIAQGFATDRVSEVLNAHGFAPHLVHIGEYRAGEQSAHIGIAGQQGEVLDSIQLFNSAVATSAPLGTRFENGNGHIVNPDLTKTIPSWRSVSVKAKTAAEADGLSTAIALTASPELAKQAVEIGLAQAIWLEATTGELLRF